MTAIIDETAETTGSTGVGRIARVIGPVVDIEFPVTSMPNMYNKLETELTLGDDESRALDVLAAGGLVPPLRLVTAVDPPAIESA